MVFIILVALTVLSCFGLVSCQPRALSDRPHVYDILPGSEEWIEMTAEGRLESCRVTREEVGGMSTTALLTTVLDYPFLGDMLAFNSLQMGIDAVSSHFPGLPELLSREDASQALAVFLETSVSDEDDSNVAKRLFAQVLAGYIAEKSGEILEADDQELIVPSLDDIREHGYPVNSNGETYGGNVKELLVEPDLVLVQNSDGVLGYVRNSDLSGAEPSSPEEAAQYQPETRYVTMYLQDGETVIGTFCVGG